jgi:ketosteroid isomerase-like protein
MRRRKPRLLEILERFCSRFTARDADGVMRLFARDADVVMVTSEEALLRGPDEMRAGLRAGWACVRAHEA